MKKLFLATLIGFFACQPAAAQRRPVLPQIDLPHPYYYRELYLPQLTSGPSSVAWSPDSKEAVYSMAGSLWRQRIDSTMAVQLTDGPGYDYQPDWSPDGKSVVFVSYQKDAMELWLLDLASGKTRQLTQEGAVNVEPRWSPDGKRIVFVSSAYNKRFHIFRADVVHVYVQIAADPVFVRFRCQICLFPVPETFTYTRSMPTCEARATNHGRVAGGRGVGKTGLHGDCGVQRSPVDGGGLVSIAEFGISHSSRQRTGRCWIFLWAAKRLAAS